jgi:plasmid maintenance system antidote protein VapI
METLIEKYKGIHPGLILERELKKRNLKKGPFALSLKEYPQVLGAITKGRRGITPELSLKIDHALGLEEGTMFVLQAWFEVTQQKQKMSARLHPDLQILRKILFWDTDINKIDWQKQYKAVIERIFERGNKEEKEEAIRFYGKEKVRSVTHATGISDGRIPLKHSSKS